MARTAIDLNTLTGSWLEAEGTRDQIAALKTLSATPGRTADWPSKLEARVRQQLEQSGLQRPYQHQASAIERFLEGRNVLIQTGTSSGKSLCYQAPTLQVLNAEPAARVLYIFPTNALAQDQLGKLERLLPEGYRCGTYDGDTPKSQRGSIRQGAHVILTNPDMLHLGILPGHENWIRFLKSLRLIVLDELHMYKGAFGSHVAGILRRLLRLCAWHSSSPQIIACSATVANGIELANKLTSQPFTVVDFDTAPKSKKTFLFWNPPEEKDGSRASTNGVSASILAETASLGLKTLCFSRSRVGSELVLRYARAKVAGSDAKKIESYRGGYTAKERRQIEQALFKGKLVGLSATNALELGVDIGGLDVVVMNGYPGSISGFWQQSGRSGRSSREGLAVLVARDDPLDQFLMRSPSLLLDGLPEPVVVHPENPIILSQQLRCAAYERALSITELGQFGDTALSLAEAMDQSGELAYRNGLFFYPSHAPPSATVNIRGTGEGSVRLIVADPDLGLVELGSMDLPRALAQAHPGAVYLHRGESYVVNELDLTAQVARLNAASLPYYTRSVAQSLLVPRQTIDMKPGGVATLTYGSVSVTDSIVAYQKIDLEKGTILETLPLELPPQTFDTLALRIDLPLIEEAETAVFGVHALEHLLLALAPWVAGCDRTDLGSAWFAQFHETLRPAVFLFDRLPGGLGLCEVLYRESEGFFRKALSLLESCPCHEGCPACILSPACESANEYLSKREAIRLLRHLVT